MRKSCVTKSDIKNTLLEIISRIPINHHFSLQNLVYQCYKMAAAQKTLSRLPRVLSIQSHVVHGFAGNRSVVLPLQLNDFEVDNINTVQKCNHSGYLRAGGQFTGTVLSIQDFKDIIY